MIEIVNVKLLQNFFRYKNIVNFLNKHVSQILKNRMIINIVYSDEKKK